MLIFSVGYYTFADTYTDALNLGDPCTESGQNVQGSLSAASKPIVCNQIVVGKKALAEIYTMNSSRIPR